MNENSKGRHKASKDHANRFPEIKHKLDGVLTFTHINGSFDHFLERARFFLPATGLNLTAMGLCQEMQHLKKKRDIFFLFFYKFLNL